MKTGGDGIEQVRLIYILSWSHLMAYSSLYCNLNILPEGYPMLISLPTETSLFYGINSGHLKRL